MCSYLSVLSDLCAAAPAGLEAEASDTVAESLASPTVDDGSSFGGSSSLSTGFGSPAGGASCWKYGSSEQETNTADCSGPAYKISLHQNDWRPLHLFLLFLKRNQIYEAARMHHMTIF